MASRQRQAFRMCVLPCPNLNGWGYTHSLCCLFGGGACTVSARERFFGTPALWALRGASPADAPIWPGVLSRGHSSRSPGLWSRRLQSWGSQRDSNNCFSCSTCVSLITLVCLFSFLVSVVLCWSVVFRPMCVMFDCVTVLCLAACFSPLGGFCPRLISPHASWHMIHEW